MSKQGSTAALNKSTLPSNTSLSLDETKTYSSKKDPQDHEIVFSPSQTLYENTYQTKPLRKFQSSAVKKMIEDLLAARLAKVKYDPATTPEFAKQLTSEVLAAVKELKYDRYKYIVDVSIGEFKGQGVKLGSRCIWDVTTDSFASTSYRNASIFAVCLVFGIFTE